VVPRSTLVVVASSLLAVSSCTGGGKAVIHGAWEDTWDNGGCDDPALVLVLDTAPEEVTVQDQGGRIVGLGETSRTTMKDVQTSAGHSTCHLRSTYSVEVTTADFYEVTIGQRKPIRVSEAELAKRDYRLDI
jgi:hypothetical protein